MTRRLSRYDVVLSALHSVDCFFDGTNPKKGGLRFALCGEELARISRAHRLAEGSCGLRFAQRTIPLAGRPERRATVASRATEDETELAAALAAAISLEAAAAEE